MIESIIDGFKFEDAPDLPPVRALVHVGGSADMTFYSACRCADRATCDC